VLIIILGDTAMCALYFSDNEYQQHSQAICSLSSRHHLSEKNVRNIYEKVLKDFVDKAKFRKYLIVLVSRRVNDILRKSKKET